MASVRKVTLADGSTRWRVRVFLGSNSATGKRTYVTRTFDRKKDADAEATRLERQKDLGALTVLSKEDLATYLVRWLDTVKEGRVRARTLHDYRGMVRRYIEEPPTGAPPIGAIRLDRLAPAAFETLYAFLWREVGLSPRSLQLLHSILRQALGHAVRTGALVRNPTDAVKPPRQQVSGGTPKRKMRAMAKEEADRFLRVAASDRLASLWVILLMGGLRPSEALGLLWHDVDLDQGRLHIRRSLTRRGVEGWKLVEPKTASARRVVVLPEVATVTLRAHRRRQAEERLQLGSEYEDNGLIFTTTLGRPLDLANLYRVFKRILKTAELGAWSGEGKRRRFTAGFRMYDLRHTCATLLLLAGENPKVVSERLGHASVTLTLDTYSHVLPAMQEESARKLDEMFAPPLPAADSSRQSRRRTGDGSNGT